MPTRPARRREAPTRRSRIDVTIKSVTTCDAEHEHKVEEQPTNVTSIVGRHDEDRGTASSDIMREGFLLSHRDYPYFRVSAAELGFLQQPVHPRVIAFIRRVAPMPLSSDRDFARRAPPNEGPVWRGFGIAR
jgi:hypothetical protein